MPVIRKYRAIADSDVPAAIARDEEVIAADAAHVSALNPHPQYLPNRPTGIEFALDNANYIDFHVNPSPVSLDFDARIIASLGTGQNGQARVQLQAGLFNVVANFSINGGAQIARFLSLTTTIDMPSTNAGAVGQINQNIPGAVMGDLALFTPLTMPTNLPFFNIQSVVSAAGVATLYFHNLSTSAIDLPSFSGRLLVLGFS